ncbi:hypothetical protein XA68_11312 [Ophiocordyceps unilateralis]|uniref:Uncharacterized protein n=1 Tax=Ophiocordyceps unilateralis TaxID=268505 RepID=A0A2A9PHB1_OPHUN|nr:hypothetical protein XA68_11312 [Ophiocordyceps unilateralis]
MMLFRIDIAVGKARLSIHFLLTGRIKDDVLPKHGLIHLKSLYLVALVIFDLTAVRRRPIRKQLDLYSRILEANNMQPIGEDDARRRLVAILVRILHGGGDVDPRFERHGSGRHRARAGEGKDRLGPLFVRNRHGFAVPRAGR